MSIVYKTYPNRDGGVALFRLHESNDALEGEYACCSRIRYEQGYGYYNTYVIPYRDGVDIESIGSIAEEDINKYYLSAAELNDIFRSGVGMYYVYGSSAFHKEVYCKVGDVYHPEDSDGHRMTCYHVPMMTEISGLDQKMFIVAMEDYLRWAGEA